ncbi:A/G-specific adenine glycosylase [Orrella daihaiensis]|uniref:Adenine DNA glycosylase n=1 Tax=Orrella daihaiensis TaxID=2782176 RepID=A0ABY4AKP4_9BURK|nr:A/G-specific adenine glycosylase [Orrella daihaiensis]UOD50216.1 A/G-specific adenine glycosylase [Orrella daihaiensis]
MATQRLALRIVNWQRTHGRNELPWQNTRDPYRVWLSEIMLQQTQVTTVIDYYHRFVERFPSVKSLANADIDEVLALWAGLGYYARARNLHACAKTVVDLWQGEFPELAADLETLPGIGASTAAAIAAFCHGQRVAILDGNVKRVLTRYFAIRDDITLTATNRRLWEIAQNEVPSHQLISAQPDAMARYTQGMMDLGATVCTRHKPKCKQCPVQQHCLANELGVPEEFPVKTVKRRDKPVRDLNLLWLTVNGHVLLEKRPDQGIWGGLWCLPTDTNICSQLGLGAAVPMASFAHELTHFRMVITPWRLHHAAASQTFQTLNKNQRWVPLLSLDGYGLPKPVRALLAGIDDR